MCRKSSTVRVKTLFVFIWKRITLQSVTILILYVYILVFYFRPYIFNTIIQKLQQRKRNKWKSRGLNHYLRYYHINHTWYHYHTRSILFHVYDIVSPACKAISSLLHINWCFVEMLSRDVSFISISISILFSYYSVKNTLYQVQFLYVIWNTNKQIKYT